MTIKFIKYFAGTGLPVLVVISVIVYRVLPGYDYSKMKPNLADNWVAPDTNSLQFSTSDKLVRYGRDLIANTSLYFGPRGKIAPISNGMNCQNCHLDAGTRPYGNNFALVATTYPKFRERSGSVESIEFRINDCMQRSLNGQKPDSLSLEVKAMKAYISWVGKNLSHGTKPPGTGLMSIPFISRAADPQKGNYLFRNKCTSCHGQNGEGLLSSDSLSYTYPPLWGTNSYNVSAGMFRISRLAGFIKYNMPYLATPTTPQLTDEEAWDLAAFIASQKRPYVIFPNDWPDISSKPVDYPFGPYTDSFSEASHKYGPFEGIRDTKLSPKQP